MCARSKRERLYTLRKSSKLQLYFKLDEEDVKRKEGPRESTWSRILILTQSSLVTVCKFVNSMNSYKPLKTCFHRKGRFRFRKISSLEWLLNGSKSNRDWVKWRRCPKSVWKYWSIALQSISERTHDEVFHTLVNQHLQAGRWPGRLFLLFFHRVYFLLLYSLSFSPFFLCIVPSYCESQPGLQASVVKADCRLTSAGNGPINYVKSI